MNKVTTINLNGRAYQIEEAGYTLLKHYLEDANLKLGDIPDKQEVLADFEQAIAEKADKRLNFHKTVLTESEIKDIIDEMGPVEGEETPKTNEPGNESTENVPPAKQLYRVREGKVLAGICNGLAAYFGIDVVLVRVIFILLALVTQGLMVFFYIIMIFIIPPADSDEKLAAAYGVPFNAQEVLNQAKHEYRSAKQSMRNWKRDRKRQWREAIRRERIEFMRPTETAGAVFLRVVCGLIAAVLTIGWMIGLVTLFVTGALFGTIWFAWPIWIIAILFTIFYGIIVSPFSEGKWNSYGCNGGYCSRPRCGGGLGSILVLIAIFWALYHFVPQTHPVFNEAGRLGQQAADAVRNW